MNQSANLTFFGGSNKEFRLPAPSLFHGGRFADEAVEVLDLLLRFAIILADFIFSFWGSNEYGFSGGGHVSQ